MDMPQAAPLPFVVHKFGGTSVASADHVERVVALMREAGDTGRTVVVVSAMGGVTDQLLGAVDQALARAGTHREVLDALRERHEAAARALALEAERATLLAHVTACLDEAAELLDGVYLLRECTGRTQDAILGIGERLSAPLVAAAFRKAGVDAEAVDARDLIRTDDHFGDAGVRVEETEGLVRSYFGTMPADRLSVVTGFIAATERGVLTTLGRSGSDYTATILGAALRAERVVIWTDVDGVLSADPRLVPEAFTLPRLSYREAAELAYFGAKVLHPRTIRPLERHGIPLVIRNTLNVASKGTVISAAPTQAEGHVKAVTTIPGVAVVMLEGAGMIGVPGIAARMFGALSARRLNVLMISQASSEQSICCAVRAEDAAASVDALNEAFVLELSRGDINRIYAVDDCAIVSAVGDQMRERPGLAGRMFSTLGRSGVNVLAIAQGASETNISAIVRQADVREAVRALHDEFALARHRVHVFVIGTGVVGKAFLDLLALQAPVLLDRLNLNIHLVGLANTRQMAWDVGGIAFDEMYVRLAQGEAPADGITSIVDRLIDSRLNRLMVVDATASDEVSHRYVDLLENRITVVTPNKRANTQDHAYYERLQRTAHRRQVPYLFETTVGAGLPILSTLRDLIRSGDHIIRIEGILSGTLAFLFNSMAQGKSFSASVRAARAAGFTEPDPRDDLNGDDVARKLLILAREMGYTAERTDVAVESLVPAHLFDVPVEAFLEGIADEDAAWARRITAARTNDMRLQYVGLIEGEHLSVKVREVGRHSPFARLDGTDNMVVYTTKRYLHNPLVVQGPGAGPEVTAAGVLADLVKAAELAG